MPSAKQILRLLLSGFLLAVTVLGLINVYGDNDEVKVQAQTTACGGTTCPNQLTRLERNPLAQTYDFVVEPKGHGKGSRTVTVKCARAQVLLGPWECKAQ